jgi:hypothetical protein
MRTLRITALSILIFGSLSVSAQDITEAYNLSNLTVQGTARSMGFGNALGSVGGDFSSVSVNPAGLGVYRSSEFTFTPSLRINSANADYISTTTSDNNSHFNINNFGIVLTNAPKGRRYDERSWKTVSFAFGMNRTADFNRNYTYQGKNSSSSGSQVFESDANLDQADAGSPNGNTLGYMGFQAFLLNRYPNGDFYSIVPFQGGVNQLKSVQENGGINEYTISLGGNYKEKLMLGITIGIPSVNYYRTSTYTESLAAGNNASNPYGFSSFTYNQTLNVTGGGINAKIGAIYKINDMFRVGAAFHSPTYYSISDLSSPSLSTQGDSAGMVSESNGNLDASRFDYNFSTPWKTVLSGTIMLNNLGFITADYEFVDYTSMRYIYPDGLENNGITYKQEQDAMNQAIRKTYQPASNFRLGGEARIAKFFMARVGFGYYGNAYSSYGQSLANQSYSTERIDLSAGLGFRFSHFFTDLGLVHSMYTGYEQPYSIDYAGVISGPPATVPTAKVNYAINNVALTLGVKF